MAILFKKQFETKFFEDFDQRELPEHAYYKVYNDGGHHVGTMLYHGYTTKRIRVNKQEEIEEEPKRDEYQIMREKRAVFAYLKAITSPLAEDQTLPFDRYQKVQCSIFDKSEKSEEDEKLIPIKKKLQTQKKTVVDLDPNAEALRLKNNLFQRLKRFRRKAYLNKWNYFASFTYADGKCTEDEFRLRLKKAFSNLATRRGWKYMGVFERGEENNRLHFHCLLNIPKIGCGELDAPGRFFQREKYSNKKHKMVETTVNSHFDEKFGDNDFSFIDEKILKVSNTINYLLKYIEKSGERIIYSRGIPTEIITKISNSEIVTKFFQSAGKFVRVLKYVFFDDTITDDIVLKSPPPHRFDKALLVAT